MIWLTWRQFRAQAAVAFAALAGVVVVLAITGTRLREFADPGGHFEGLRLLGTALIGVPAVIGAFWGVPLLTRELESGTHRMAWTQSVTRSHWLTDKLVVVGCASVLLTAVFSLLFTWWSLPFDRIGNRVGSANFGQRGIAPVGYAVFALVLGVAVGMVIRRTLPAMATTLVAFFVVRFGFQTWVRSHLIGTETITAPVLGINPGQGVTGHVLGVDRVDAAGRLLTETGFLDLCGLRGTRPSDGALSACAQRLGIHDVVRLQADKTFWTVQAYETAIFLVLAVALGAFCFWWIRRRVA